MPEMRTTPLDHLPADFNLETLRAHLTDQEIAALQEGDDPAFPDAIEAKQPDPVPAADPAPVAAAEQPKPIMPVLPDVPDTTAAKATVETFDSKLDDLQRKFDDGELDTIELRNAMKALAAEQAQAQALIQQAQSLEQIRADTTQAAQATVQQQWSASLEAYKAKNPELWSDEHVGGWDAALRAVTGGPLGETLTLAQCIEKAHEIYRMNYTAATGKVLGAPKMAEDGKTPIPTKPRTDPREPLQTLAGINGETTTAMTDGTFATIDRVLAADPDRGEALFKSLSPEMQKAFLMENV